MLLEMAKKACKRLHAYNCLQRLVSKGKSAIYAFAYMLTVNSAYKCVFRKEKQILECAYKIPSKEGEKRKRFSSLLELLRRLA